MLGLSRRRVVLVGAILALAAVTGVLSVAGAPDVPTFVVATAALAGLAWLVALATEVVGAHFGPAVTGFLQSSLGNLPELFVVFFALRAGEVVVAQSSILGSLFANALLVLGLVIVVGAHASSDGVMRFHRRLPQDTSTLLILAVATIALLGLAVGSGDRAARHRLVISAVGSAMLILVYIVWLLRYLRDDQRASKEAKRGKGTAGDGAGADASGRAEAAEVPLATGVILLAISGVGAALVSDWFVSALGPALTSLHLSKQFAGLVIVAIAGNAVENVTGIVLAAKGQADLAISVVKNSVSQVAVFLFPVLVLLSLFLSTHLVLVIAPVYIGGLAVTALSLWQITGDGEAYTFEGVALIVLFAVLAMFAYYG